MRASARPSWSASAQRRHAPPPWRWASPSATSAISRRRMKGEAVLLGVDVGGTTTAAGVVTRDGEVLIEQRVSTHRDGKGRVLPTIVGLIAAVRAEAEGRGRAPVKFDGGPCWCGGRGCLALYASGRGIAEAARARVAGLSDAPLLAAAGGDPRAITAPLVFRAAREGDPVASSVVDEACRALGAMLGTVVNGLNPEVVVITGGVAESLVPLAAQILARAGEYAFGQALAATRVTIVPSDKRTSMRGAAARAVALRDARQRRRLGHARLAPRRLEAQDQDLLADQIARVERALAAEDAHAEARRRRRGGERRDEAQQEQEGAEGASDHESYNNPCYRSRIWACLTITGSPHHC